MEDKIEWVKAGVLARGSRPGWWDEREIALVVREYVARVRAMGINSIVCLLSQGELVRYYAAHGVNLFAAYREAGLQLAHVPVTDHEKPPLAAGDLFKLRIVLSDLPRPWLIHCSAGIDRTGCAVKHLESKPELLQLPPTKPDRSKPNRAKRNQL